MRDAGISGFLQSRIEANDFPSAVYLVAEKGKIICQDALGFAVVEPEPTKATPETIYDLASLTKVLVTGVLCAKLLESGEIKLSDKIAGYFSEFVRTDKREIKIGNLLTHTSGFTDWKPFYLMTNEKAAVPGLIADEPLENPINSKVLYSDLNFLMLGFLLEKIYGKRLDEIAHQEIFAPLNLQNTFYNPPKNLQKRIAASEKGNEHERKICLERGYKVQNASFAFRHQVIWGEVHDGNCYFLNGIAGHAGLFSNAAEVCKIAQQFLPNQTQLLRSETCELFRANFTKGLNEARSLAFQLAETPDSTASKALSKDSFGHLGFTGTSLWIEPQNERIFILLTNRTHAHPLPFVNINAVRRKFHEIAQKILTIAPK
jgi:CubicO group peptidase (beta-lactamase class C family)